jgi:DNA end-binding protein Ku
MSTPRSTGSATIWLSDVSVPVKVYPALKDPPKVELVTVHKDCGSRIKQEYRCPVHADAPLARELQAKAYEVAKDRFVVFEPGDLEAVQPEPDPDIRVEGLVAIEDVDPVHWGKPSYLGPELGKGPVVDPEPARRYAWLADVLRLEGKAAIGRWATRGRDLLVAIRAAEGRLVLQELRRAEEVRCITDIEAPPAPAGTVEVTLGLRLAGSLELEAFDPAAYPDERYQRTVALIQAKVEGKAIAAAPPAEGKRGQVVDLLQALELSLGEGRRGPHRAEPSRRPARKATR